MDSDPEGQGIILPLRNCVNTPRYNSPTIEEVDQALSFLDANCDRGYWARIAMAIKSEFGNEGFQIWDAWSQRGASYDKSSAKSTWRSIKSSGSSGTVTIGTLFKDALNCGWKPDKSDISEEERQRRAELADKRKLKREQEEAAAREDQLAWREAYRKFFSENWGRLLSDFGSSPYLGQKGIGWHGLGFPRESFVLLTDIQSRTVSAVSGRAEISDFFSNSAFKDKSRYSFRYVKRGSILVPLRSYSGQIYNAQIIFPTGNKSYLKSAPKMGLWHMLGNPMEGRPICIAEGYATGASIFEACGLPVAVAFDLQNLVNVSKRFRKVYPNSPLLLCGDDDFNTEGNPGRTVVTNLANEIGCKAVFPTITEGSA